jgi:hypothetical protein
LSNLTSRYGIVEAERNGCGGQASINARKQASKHISKENIVGRRSELRGGGAYPFSQKSGTPPYPFKNYLIR